MGKYQGYDKYKDSGVEWLGDIPEHWEVKHLKNVASITRGAILRPVNDPSYFDENGEWLYLNISDVTKCEKFLYTAELKLSDIGSQKSARVLENNLILTASATIGIPIINKVKVCIHDGFIAFKEIKTNLFFLYYVLLNKSIYSAMGKTNTQKNIYLDEVKIVKIGFPPLEEQEKIARFLDYKTKQIDELIAKKETLIEKLDEKRTSLISHAVTKGIDENVPMKDSGIEWLGEIPKHWEVKNLRYICEFLNKRRIPLSSEERGSMSDKIYPYYGASGIIDYVENFIFDEPTILIAEDGANLLSRSTPLAFIAEGKYWVNNHAHILKPFSGNFKYWANLLCIIEYDYWITGSAQPKLTKDNLGSIKLADPPLQEQQKIAEYLDKKTAQIEEQKTKIQQAIDVLKEYRTALITNAVTGKINVSQVDIP